MYYSGIDQHKRDCMITTYDTDGRRVKQQWVPNSRDRLRRYFPGFSGPQGGGRVDGLLVLAGGLARGTGR